MTQIDGWLKLAGKVVTVGNVSLYFLDPCVTSIDTGRYTVKLFNARTQKSILGIDLNIHTMKIEFNLLLNTFPHVVQVTVQQKDITDLRSFITKVNYIIESYETVTSYIYKQSDSDMVTLGSISDDTLYAASLAMVSKVRYTSAEWKGLVMGDWN